MLAGDDTDGHIDNLVRFCNEDLIVYSAIGHKSDQNSNALQSLKTQLNALAKRNNKEIVPLPLPTPIISNKHQLPASYTNFLISNNYVFVPVFNDINDNHTLKLLDECFPEKDIIEIESNALIQQFGGIHCASMQIPQGLLL